MPKLYFFAAVTFLLGMISACVSVDDISDKGATSQKQVGFDITVTRDGKELETKGTQTKGQMIDAGDMLATMDTRRPFGLVGIEKGTNTLLINNSPVYSTSDGYKASFDSELWEIPSRVLFSAYYPHVKSIVYGDDNNAYSIPYTVNETEAGPLISKTVERAINQLNILPLEFQHITNDIGFKVCDATPKEELQGLIHLRKLVATNVASAGIYLNDLTINRGSWNYQGYYRNEVVFDGDVLVGVGSENEKFVGYNTLEDHLATSHRYYSIPDEIEIGKQCVEVLFDVDGFELGGFEYPPLKDQVFKYMLYGLLPNNVFVPGKQYTFHIGLDLSSIYQEITFSASVSGWETKIYENNDDF
jgi:hypothetical protein